MKRRKLRRLGNSYIVVERYTGKNRYFLHKLGKRRNRLRKYL